VSEVLQGAIASGGFGLAVLLLTRYFNVQDRKEENRSRLDERHQEIQAGERERMHADSEWLKRTLLERRLQAVSEAHSWLMKLNRERNLANPTPEDVSRLVKSAQDAREWYDRNVIYLHDDLPMSSHFIGAFNSAPDSQDRGFFGRNLDDCLKYLQQRASSLMNQEPPQT
jgi:hypothetical protein